MVATIAVQFMHILFESWLSNRICICSKNIYLPSVPSRLMTSIDRHPHPRFLSKGGQRRAERTSFTMRSEVFSLLIRLDKDRVLAYSLRSTLPQLMKHTFLQHSFHQTSYSQKTVVLDV